jgi:hypothetical protein
MGDLDRISLLVKLLAYASLCVGSAWIVRVSVFGIVADSARILIPAGCILFVARGTTTSFGIAEALSLWCLCMVFFWAAREFFDADDILLSLGLQATVFGGTSLFVVESFGKRYLDSPIRGEINAWRIAILMLLVLGGSIYVLSFSNFRVDLAHAALGRRPSAAFPKEKERKEPSP